MGNHSLDSRRDIQKHGGWIPREFLNTLVVGASASCVMEKEVGMFRGLAGKSSLENKSLD